MVNFRKIIIVLVLSLFLLKPTLCLASSNYVLPYPSFMPGSKIYTLHVIWEKAMKYWYFGDFGQFDYNLQESDKYLVEAKTLFEYKQYLLAYKALQKSNSYFINTAPSLVNAKKHGKNITEKISILRQASEKHIEVLDTLRQNVPLDFVWSPEKSASQNLDISSLISQSLSLRESYEKNNF